MGGEPLCEENLLLTLMVLTEVKNHFPDTKVYLWTGYYYNELKKRTDSKINLILEKVDVLIDGPYEETLRDITLKMRGSSNQHIIEFIKFENS